MDKEILTAEDVAGILKIKTNTVYTDRWKAKTGCPMVKHGKRLLITRDSFWKWFSLRADVSYGKQEK